MLLYDLFFSYSLFIFMCAGTWWVFKAVQLWFRARKAYGENGPVERLGRVQPPESLARELSIVRKHLQAERRHSCRMQNGRALPNKILS